MSHLNKLREEFKAQKAVLREPAVWQFDVSAMKNIQSFLLNKNILKMTVSVTGGNGVGHPGYYPEEITMSRIAADVAEYYRPINFSPIVNGGRFIKN